MAKNVNHVLHIKSSTVIESKPKLPNASSILEGEIAVNFADGYETLSIKNSNGKITPFSSDDYYTEKKLGSGFTDENSAKTVTDAYNEISNVLSGKVDSESYENDSIVISAALNYLNNSKLDISAYTPVDLSNYYTKSETSGKTEISNALSGKLDATAYTPTDLTNYYTKSETSGATELSNALGSKVNSQTFISHTSNTTVHVTSDEKEAWDAKADESWVEEKLGSSFTGANSANTVTSVIRDNELVVSSALNDLKATKMDLSAYTPTDLTNYYTKSETSGKTEISNALSGKLDATAYTPTDLSNYYTKSETSGKTEISNALSGKVDYESYENDSMAISIALNDLNSSKLDISALQTFGESIHFLTGMTGEAGGTNLSASWSGNCSEITSLYTGLCIRFIIPSAGHKSGTTLSINGEEKHPIIYNASSKLTTQYGANLVLNLTYDEDASATYYNGSTETEVQGVWRTNGEYYSDTNTDYNIGHNQQIYKTDKAAYRYVLLLQKNETTLTPVNTTSNSTAGTKTLTTSEFNPFGDIIYKSSTATTSAGGIIPSGVTWTQYPINLAYSFNTTNTLSAQKSVYIVAVPQSNGNVKLHSSPISQTLPTTEDGLVYIYLGQAYSTTNIYLMNNHPVYEFKNGKLRLYVGSFGTMAYENAASYSSATQVNTALGNKLDTTAYTPTDLTNYYTKSETSGKTEISTALSNCLQGTLTRVAVSSNQTNVNPASSLASGSQLHIIYYNNGSADYTISVTTTYTTPDGQQIVLTCPQGGYCELNIMNIDGVKYARGI